MTPAEGSAGAAGGHPLAPTASSTASVGREPHGALTS